MDSDHVRAPDTIRVLYVNPGGDALGGAERSLLGLIDGLDRAAVAPSAVVFGEGSMVDALRDRGVATTSLPLRFRTGASYENLVGRLTGSGVAARSLVLAAAAVYGAIDRAGARVVHTNGMRAHILLPAIRRRGVATVASIRDLPRSGSEALLLRGVLRSAGAVIANSDYVRRQLRDGRNVQVIDNPIGAPRLPARLEARRELGLPPDAFVVAMLAHFHAWKGHLDLLRAVEPLDDVWVILAGGDLYGRSSTAYRDDVLSFARARGLAHRVLCIGAVDDVGPVYAAADVVAHCSTRPEPFGRTLVEAMLAQKPVVASSAGAPGEFVRHSSTGLLYAPGDAEGLRAHLIRLRENPELGQVLSRNALVDIADRFDQERHAAQVLAVYRSVSRTGFNRVVQRQEGNHDPRATRQPSRLRLHPNRTRTTTRPFRWSPIGRELGPTLEGGFARRIVSYLGVLNIGQRARFQALASTLHGLPDPRVVFDVGCRHGLNSLLLARRFPGARVVGIDIDPSVLETAKRCAASAGVTNLEFQLAGADHIEAPGQADLVVCVDVLEHVVDDKRFAAELVERVSPAGTLVVHVPLRDQHFHVSSVRENLLRAIEEGRDPHVREGYREVELRRLFASDFHHFQVRRTLGGLASVAADLEALSGLEKSVLPRLVGLALLPFAGYSGGRWAKGVLAVGRGRRSEG